MGYYSVFKRNKILLQVTRINLEDAMLSEKNPATKRQNTVGFHLHEVSRLVVKFIDQKENGGCQGLG